MKNQQLKLPYNNLNTSLHLSAPRVELIDSTKFDVFLSEHRAGSNLCLAHLSWAPKSRNN